jgi:hypothetical protein
MTRKLQITLYVIAAYLAFFGILFLFAPGVFEQITQNRLPDAKLTLMYGQYTLTFAFMAFMAAREKEAASKLSLTILIVTLGNAFVFRISACDGDAGLCPSWTGLDCQFCTNSPFVPFPRSKE